MKPKPLTVESANPCMKCGSVQCAICSDDIKSALQGLKQELRLHQRVASPEMDELTYMEVMVIINRWFPTFNVGE